MQAERAAAEAAEAAAAGEDADKEWRDVVRAERRLAAGEKAVALSKARLSTPPLTSDRHKEEAEADAAEFELRHAEARLEAAETRTTATEDRLQRAIDSLRLLIEARVAAAEERRVPRPPPEMHCLACRAIEAFERRRTSLSRYLCVHLSVRVCARLCTR